MIELYGHALINITYSTVQLHCRVDCHYTPPSNLPPNAKFPFFKVDPSATKDNFSVTLLYTEGWASWKQMQVLLANAGNKIFSTMTKLINSVQLLAVDWCQDSRLRVTDDITDDKFQQR
jgi:hypothetical protein